MPLAPTDIDTPDKLRGVVARIAGEGEGQAKAIADLTDAMRRLQESRPVVATVDASNGAERRYAAAQGEQGPHVRRGIRWQTAEKGGPAGLLDDPRPASEWVAETQRLVSQRSIVRIMCSGGSARTDAALAAHFAQAPQGLQRIHADISTVGAETIPDLLVPELERALILAQERRLLGLFRSVPMSGKEYRVPFLSSGLRPYIKGEPASASDNSPAQYTASNLALAQRSVSARALAVRAVLDEDYAEDDVIGMQSELQMALADAINDALEDAILNGDTGTHGDTGIASWDIRGRWGSTGLGTAADHRRLWIGLRHNALDVASNGASTDDGSAQTLAGMLAGRGKMGVAGTGNVACIVSPEYALKIHQFSQLVSADVLGERAPNVTGFLGVVAGMPVIITPYMDRQLNASGVYDNSTKTKTGMILVNVDRWKLYQRRGVTVETGRDIGRGTTEMVATWRGNFVTHDVNAVGTTNVHYSFNLTP